MSAGTSADRVIHQTTFDIYAEPGDRFTRVGDSEVGHHHSNPSDTELRGALSVVPKRGDQKKRLLALYRAAGRKGYTDHELVAASGLPLSSINSIRASLKKRGLVEDSGERREGPTKLPNIVWRATQ